MRLAQPWALLLVLPVLAAAAAVLLRPGGARLSLPWDAPGPGGPGPSPRARAARWAPPLLAALALTALAIALAKPQSVVATPAGEGEGVDIMLVVDSSLSMGATDLKPNRLAAAQDTALRFTRGRVSDRIGLVTFGGAPLLACPLTTDYDALQSRLEDLEPGMTRTDGTAIGDGLAAAARRLKDSKAKSRVIVLLTDGRSNAGAVDPLTAAKAAASLGVKIYAIGAASKGRAAMPVDDPRFGRVLVQIDDDLDEELLARVADLTGGKSWRAPDARTLAAVFAEIDRLEKSAVALPRLTVTADRHAPWLWLAAVLLLLESALAAGPLLRWP